MNEKQKKNIFWMIIIIIPTFFALSELCWIMCSLNSNDFDVACATGAMLASGYGFFAAIGAPFIVLYFTLRLATPLNPKVAEIISKKMLNTTLD